MKRIIKTSQLLITLFSISALCGCSLLYDLQPHRLRRLNQGEGMSRDAYYSVSDSSLKKLEAPELPTNSSETKQAE